MRALIAICAATFGFGISGDCCRAEFVELHALQADSTTRNAIYRSPTSRIDVGTYYLKSGLPSYLIFSLGGKGELNASLTFSTYALNQPLRPGDYWNAQRAAFADPGHPGLDISFSHVGYNTSSGMFVIHEVTFQNDALGWPQLNTFSADYKFAGDRTTITGSITYARNVIPEPSTLLIMGVGLAACAGISLRRRFRKRVC
jgi:hypothetical protein